MEIKINKGQIITSVCLAVAGWFALETYVQGQRISALEENREVNSRQDEELIELRKTVRDITVLFLQGPKQQFFSFTWNALINMRIMIKNFSCLLRKSA